MHWNQAAAGTGAYHSYPLTPGVGTILDGPAQVMDLVWKASSLVGTVAGAYHGYKRNQSVGWAVVWALCGSIAPIITVPVAIGQGFGKPKRG